MASRAEAARSVPTQVGAQAASSRASSPTCAGVVVGGIDAQRAAGGAAVAAGEEVNGRAAGDQAGGEVQSEGGFAGAADAGVAAADHRDGCLPAWAGQAAGGDAGDQAACGGEQGRGEGAAVAAPEAGG